MSIAPPSDIIMDVAQAADPARRQAAVDKLAQAAAQGGSPPVDFGAALVSTTPAPRPSTATSGTLPLSPLGAARSQARTSHLSTYQKFEAVLLRNFVESILPKDSELYGDATSADMCRSLMAEKLADQLARSGRIGIAQTIERRQAAADAHPAAPAAVGATS